MEILKISQHMFNEYSRTGLVFRNGKRTEYNVTRDPRSTAKAGPVMAIPNDVCIIILLI